MARRGPISIDRIVALRSSVLPLYVLIRPDGSVATSDELSEDGNDFFTTRMYGDQISFQSVRGHYLSAEGGDISTRPYCSADERFTVERLEAQYAFRSRSGQYLSVLDRAPFLALTPVAGDTEMFQLFSLMMCGVNVGKQLDMLERSGHVRIDNLVEESELATMRGLIDMYGGKTFAPRTHEVRCPDLVARSALFGRLAVHPLVMQIALRSVSPRLRLSELESCCTNADVVRKELEATTWQVVHPYSSVEFPGIVDARASLTATWFLDTLDEENSTWACVKAPLADATHLPKLPQLSSPEEREVVLRGAAPLMAPAGSVWLYAGPVWTSNNVGAASFWKDYDAQTRYKHLSGQKEQTTFRALTDAQQAAPARHELCPTVLEATYVREFIAPRRIAQAVTSELLPAEVQDLQRLGAA